MAPPATARPPVGAEPPQDALTYVRAVKSRFQATKPEVYEAFLEVMRDFKNARCVANDEPKGAPQWRFSPDDSALKHPPLDAPRPAPRAGATPRRWSAGLKNSWGDTPICSTASTASFQRCARPPVATRPG